MGEAGYPPSQVCRWSQAPRGHQALAPLRPCDPGRPRPTLGGPFTSRVAHTLAGPQLLLLVPRAPGQALPSRAQDGFQLDHLRLGLFVAGNEPRGYQNHSKRSVGRVVPGPTRAVRAQGSHALAREGCAPPVLWGGHVPTKTSGTQQVCLPLHHRHLTVPPDMGTHGPGCPGRAPARTLGACCIGGITTSLFLG